MENEAHSPRAKPRQRLQDLFWKWKLVENPDCLHSLPSRPQRSTDANFPLRSLLETPIPTDNHCQPPHPCPPVYCKSPAPEESISRFCQRKWKSTHENASRPWVRRAAFLPSPLRALPRAFRVHTCTLSARTASRLRLPTACTWSQQPARLAASPVEGFEEEFPLRSSLHFAFSSFLLKLLFNDAKGSTYTCLGFFFFSFFKLEFFLTYTF